jgi:SulP family sulfate permease
MVKALPEIEVVIIRMDKVPYVDQSGLYAMEEAVIALQAKGIKVAFTDLKGQPLAIFERFNLIPRLVEREYCFESFREASAWLEGYLKDKDFKPQSGQNIKS